MPRVIRHLPSGRGRSVPAAVSSARTQAAHIRAAAEAEAKQVLQQARQDADSVLSAAKAEAEELVHRARSESEAESALIRAHAVAAAEKDIVALAMTAAERIVGAELAIAPDKVSGLVQDVLRRTSAMKDITLFLNPEDKRHLDALLSDSQSTSETGVRLVEDASLSRGSCVVSSRQGEIDARLEVRLQAIKRALLSE